MASIMEYNQRKSPDYLCAGVLISERHILTAAHCFDPRPHQNPRLYSVQLESESTEYGAEYGVYDVDVHPDYLPGSSYYDLAVVTLRRDVANDTMPICLPTRTADFDNRLSYVLEWSPKYYGKKAPMTLRARRALISNNGECGDVYSNIRTQELPRGIIAGQICTDVRGNEGGCDRYLGSPMIVPDRSYRWSAVGVATFLEKCGDPNFPGIYTKVTHYLPWIQRIMKNV
ncbi:clotting factor B-like [Haemaphysalis longicornis]